MNVYDAAHSLEAAIKESEEFKQYEAVRQQVAQNKQLNDMLDDFHIKQMQIQSKQMMGEQLGPEDMQKLQELYQIIAQDPLAAQFLQCEMRFSVMMQDVFQILGDVMAIGTNKPAGA